MSGTTVPVPVAILVKLRDELAQESHTLRHGHWPSERGRVNMAGRLQDLANTLNEAVSLAELGEGRDFEALLGEVLEAVQLRGGRLGLAIPSREGVDAALAAFGELGPVLARQPGDREALTQELREAVRVQTPVYRLEIVKGSRLNTIVETIEAQPCARIPLVNEEIILDDGRCATVAVVTHEGAAVVVRAKVWGHPGTEEF